MAEVNDAELKTVIADFLDMGFVENIVAMFRRDARYYAWTGELLRDSRFQVRLGVAVLFEELRKLDPVVIDLATPSLLDLLHSVPPLPTFVRGDAVGVLAIIGSESSMEAVRVMTTDPESLVAELAQELLGEAA